MKKFLFLMLALAAMTSCGNSGKGPQSASDSASESGVADTLLTTEAVERQVAAVYDYWNSLREHFDEEKPSVDERFGSKEWWRVRLEVAAIDRECECGGFFDFGDEGPLDPWTYDCYEGTVGADSVQVKLLTDSTAEVRFLVKDAVTIKGRPMRWQMKLEEGAWRVANIIFEKDDNFDILLNMRAYAAKGSDSTESQADGVDAAPEDDWTEEAVARQIQKYFEDVNKTFAEGSGMNPFDLDKKYYSAYWNEVYEAVCEKESYAETAEKRFFIDDNPWTAGIEAPVEARNINVQLLTGTMPEAVYTLAEKNHGFSQKAILTLDYERGVWRISNWLEKNHDPAASILVKMEKYIGL